MRTGVLPQSAMQTRNTDSGGNWSRIFHVEPTLRSHAVESAAVGRCGRPSGIGGAGRCGDPRAKSGKHRPYAGTAQRMIREGVVRIICRPKDRSFPQMTDDGSALSKTVWPPPRFEFQLEWDRSEE